MTDRGLAARENFTMGRMATRARQEYDRDVSGRWPCVCIDTCVSASEQYWRMSLSNIMALRAPSLGGRSSERHRKLYVAARRERDAVVATLTAIIS